jgi:hypothetical protein
MKKKNMKFITPVFLLISISFLFTNTSAVISEDWGVEIGDSIEFTGGYNIGVTMPDSIWTILNDGWIDAMGVPEGETIDFKNFINEIMTELVSVANVQINITDIYDRTVDTGLDSFFYDCINITAQVKNTGEEDYGSIESFASQWMQDVGDLINNSIYFPDSVGESMAEMLTSPLPIPEGTFDEIPIMNWLTDIDGSSYPDYMIDLGLGGPIGAYVPIFIPKDLDFNAVLVQALNDPMLGGMGPLYKLLIENYIGEVGISDLAIREKEIYLDFDLSDLNGALASYLGLTEFGDWIMEMVGMPYSPIGMIVELLNTTGIELDPYSISANAIVGARWDENGILENFHIDISVVAEINSEEFSFSFEVDISQGEYEEISQKFDGPPTPSDPASLSEDWGVDIGDKIYFTSEYDFDVNFPAEIWDVIDVSISDMAGEYFDIEGIFNSLMTDLPTAINYEVEVTNMDAVEFVMPGEPDIQYAFDMIFSQINVKLPSETEYGSIESLVNRIIDNNLDDFLDSFPDNIVAQLEDLLDEMPSIPENIIPTRIPTMWCTDSNATLFPDFMLEMGGSMLGGGAFPLIPSSAISNIMFIPTDMNYSDVYEGLEDYLIVQAIISGDSLAELMEEFGITSIDVLEKEITIEFNLIELESPYSDIFNTQLEFFAQALENVDIFIDNDTVTSYLTLSINWSSEGILDNFLFEAGIGIESTYGDISIDFTYELSNLDDGEEVFDDFPTADFTTNSTSGLAPLTIKFTDTSVSDDGISSWEWNFGDGSTNSILQNPIHTYTTAGTYTVTLTVVDVDGDIDTITTEITVLTDGDDDDDDGDDDEGFEIPGYPLELVTITTLLGIVILMLKIRKKNI